MIVVGVEQQRYKGFSFSNYYPQILIRVKPV